MKSADPGATFEATVDRAPTGLVGTITVAIEDGQGNIVSAPTVENIVASATGPGIYTATLTAPVVAGEYVIVWVAGSFSGAEDLYVGTSVPGVPSVGEPSTRYTSLAAVRAYTPLAAGVADSDLQLVIDRAERDVDSVLIEPVPWGRQDSGLKYDPTSLEAWRAAALNRATSAQTEYRLAMGEDFFIRAQHTQERGPDFAVTGALPYIGPKVYRELTGAALIATPGIGQIAVGGTILSSSTGWVDTNAD